MSRKIIFYILIFVSCLLAGCANQQSTHTKGSTYVKVAALAPTEVTVEAERPLLGSAKIKTSVSKEQIDDAARKNGFPKSDYPYCEGANGCGPDDWKGKLVPEGSIFNGDVKWTPFCNQHDRDYMDLTLSQDQADEWFRMRLHGAIWGYLSQTVVVNGPVQIRDIQYVKKAREITKTCYRRVKQRVRVQDFWNPLKWATVWIEIPYTCKEIIWETVKEEVDVWKDTPRSVIRMHTVSKDAMTAMHAEAEAFFQAVHNGGRTFYENAQRDQHRYEQWVVSFLATLAIDREADKPR